MVQRVEFKSYNDLARYIYNNHIREIGSGSEGTVYLGKDGFAYKLFYEEPWCSDTKEFDPYEIITIDDADLECFAFPMELYIVDGKVKGSKTKLVKKDLVSTMHTTSYLDFYDVDIYDFHAAYLRLVEDVKKLSEMKIQLFDVINNVMFDGKGITVVDTFYYTREEYDTYIRNIHIVEKAIEEIFNFWLENSDLEAKEITDHDVLAYLEAVSDAMSECNRSESFFFEEIINKKKRS